MVPFASRSPVSTPIRGLPWTSVDWETRTSTTRKRPWLRERAEREGFGPSTRLTTGNWHVRVDAVLVEDVDRLDLLCSCLPTQRRRRAARGVAVDADCQATKRLVST